MRRSGYGLLVGMALVVQFGGCQGEQTAEVMSAAAPVKLEALLPTASELGEWELAVIKIYDSDNLFEYIDGEAQAFVGYDFRELLSARFVHKSDPEQKAIIDIYDMRTLDNAFGIYSSRRSPEAAFLEVGVQGYVAEGELESWKSRFFVSVEIRGLEAGADEEAVRLARLVAARIPAAADRPRLAGLLPKEHQSPHTLVYYRRNVLGYGFLESGMQATYKSGEESWELFVCQFGSRRTASKAFSKLRDEWSKMADLKGKVENLGEEAFALEDSYFGRVIIFRQQAFIAIGLGVKSQQARTSLARLEALTGGEK